MVLPLDLETPVAAHYTYSTYMPDASTRSTLDTATTVKPPAVGLLGLVRTAIKSPRRNSLARRVSKLPTANMHTHGMEKQSHKFMVDWSMETGSDKTEAPLQHD